MKEKDEKLVDEMESIRVTNNTHWMDLVRLGLEVAPRRTRAILKGIAERDSLVRNVLFEIAEGGE